MAESKTTTWEQERSRMRAVANNVILHLHPTRVPAGALRLSYTWGLGGISALLALLLVITGVLLMFRYEPNIQSAYSSVLELEAEVPFGSLFRAIHHWSANLLIVTVFLHLVRIFLTGGFRRRGLNWLLGIGLLLLVIAFNFTGYLLPWDQLSYWAVTVGTSLIAYVPLVGPELSNIVLGGPEVGQGTLRNFYALHVAVLPVLLFLSVSYHFWRIRKDGGISQPRPPAGKEVEGVTTIPNLVQIEFAAAAILLVVVVSWAMWVPAPLGDLANAMESPNPAKAAWYFLGFQELLLHMHALAAMALIGFVLLGLLVLPRWDRDEATTGIYFRSPTGRRAALLGALLSLDLIPLLVVADELWIDLPGWLPTWPTYLSNGVLPLLLSLGALALIYALARLLLKANHSEGLVALFTFIVVSLILMTITGIYFRGPNMDLIIPLYR